MKFCIFGFSHGCPKTAKMKNNLSPDPKSCEVSWNEYNNLINEGKYEYIYFLVDFGQADDTPYFHATPIDIFNYINVPWVLISMWTKKNGKSNPMISKLRLELKGFTEEYDNIYLGLKRFEYYLELKIKCKLYCDIFDKANVFLANTNTISHRIRENNCNYCRKYRI